MNLSDLLDAGKLVKIEPDATQSADCIAAAERDLRVAKTTLAEDADWAFSIAYNAMLQAARALMFADGYRAASEEAHKTAVEYADVKLGARFRDSINSFDEMRRKRHRAVYEKVGAVSGYEAGHAVRVAEEFLARVKEKLRK